jgi:peptidoglycan/LPS O-acetylase OafA/YrhL
MPESGSRDNLYPLRNAPAKTVTRVTVVTAQVVSPRQDKNEAGVKHLVPLDGIRGLAILLVIQFHFWGLAFARAHRNPTLMIDIITNKFFGVGWVGVDLFFVLSGFLITGILYDAKHSDFYFRNFYARRSLRIFPLYYGFLAFVLFVLPNFHRLAGPGEASQLQHTQFWFWTYMANVAASVNQLHTELPLVYAQFWSLAVEEQFYLLWPLVLLVLSRSSVMILCAALIVGALAFRIILVLPFSTSFASVAAPHRLLPARVDTLALGALLALALRSGRELTRYRQHAWLVVWGSVVMLAMLFLMRGGLSPLDRHVQTIGLTTPALLFAAVLLLVLTSKPDATLYRIFTHPTLSFLGRYSYAIYVFHLLVAFEVAGQLIRGSDASIVFGSQIPMNIIYSFVCTAISITAAWLSWHLFERQVLKLKRYVPYGREPVRDPWPRMLVRPDERAAATSTYDTKSA